MWFKLEFIEKLPLAVENELLKGDKWYSSKILIQITYWLLIKSFWHPLYLKWEQYRLPTLSDFDKLVLHDQMEFFNKSKFKSY